jgi:hypothetical protein
LIPFDLIYGTKVSYSIGVDVIGLGGKIIKFRKGKGRQPRRKEKEKQSGERGKGTPPE